MAGTDIGPRIGMDGEAEFRKQLNNINTALKTLGTEMQKVTSEFSENAGGQQALIAKNRVLSESIDTQKRKIEEVSKALDEAESKYGPTANETLKWQQVLNRSQTSLNKLEQELGQNEKALDEMDKGLRDTETGLEKFGDGADKAEKEAGGLSSSLKDAFTGGAIVAGIQALASGITNLIDETTEYRRIMASLEISSQNAGYSAEETAQTYRTLYGVLGDEQTAATTTSNLQALRLSQEQLNDVTNATIGAWATYGDSIPIDSLSEAINETAKVGTVTGTFADVLNWAGTSEDDFNAKLAACSTESERMNLIMQELANQGLVAAGEAWQKNNQDITATNQATADLQSTMAEFAKILSPIVAAVKGAFNDVLQVVLGLVNAFQTGGIDGFMQELQNVIGNITGFLSGNSMNFTEIGATIINGITDGIRTYGPQILDMIGEVFGSIGENLPAMLEVLLTALQGLGDMLTEFAPVLVQKGFEMLQSLVSGLVEAIPMLVEKVPVLISTFANIINDNFPTILAKGVELVGQLIMGLIQAIPTIVANIPQIISAIVDTLTAFNWVNLGNTIITSLGNGIKNMGGFVKESAQNILNNIKNKIQELPGNLMTIGRNAISDLGGAIRGAVGVVTSAASNIVSSIVNTISGIPGRMLSIGKNIVQGLWNGISDMTGWIIGKIQGFGESVLGGIKDFFGIASPSKVMRDQVGRYMAEGIAVGFDRELVKVKQQMEQALSSVVTGTEKAVEKAQTSFQADFDYDRLARSMENQGIYIDGRLIGRALKERGFVMA